MEIENNTDYIVDAGSSFPENSDGRWDEPYSLQPLIISYSIVVALLFTSFVLPLIIIAIFDRKRRTSYHEVHNNAEFEDSSGGEFDDDGLYLPFHMHLQPESVFQPETSLDTVAPQIIDVPAKTGFKHVASQTDEIKELAQLKLLKKSKKALPLPIDVTQMEESETGDKNGKTKTSKRSLATVKTPGQTQNTAMTQHMSMSAQNTLNQSAATQVPSDKMVISKTQSE